VEHRENIVRALLDEPVRAALDRNELVTIMMDQDARDRGVFVDFLGRPASTLKSLAILSLRHRSPVLPLNIYRNGKHLRMEYGAPILPESVDGEKDRVRALTQIVSQKLEGFVRQHPEQWMWIQRRWKTRPRTNGTNH